MINNKKKIGHSNPSVTNSLLESKIRRIVRRVLNEEDEQTIFKNLLSKLANLTKFDIDTGFNGEFIEVEEIKDKNGKYILSKDLDKILSSIKNK